MLIFKYTATVEFAIKNSLRQTQLTINTST